MIRLTVAELINLMDMVGSKGYMDYPELTLEITNYYGSVSVIICCNPYAQNDPMII